MNLIRIKYHIHEEVNTMELLGIGTFGMTLPEAYAYVHVDSGTIPKPAH